MVNQLPGFVSNIEFIINGLAAKNKIDKLESIRLPGVLDKEKETMETAFQEFLLNKHETHYLVRMTKKYHHTLLMLSNRAYFYRNTAERQSQAIKELYLKIITSVEELLQSVVIESKSYLIESLTVSNYYADLHGKSLRSAFLNLEKKLIDQHADQQMIELLHEFFSGFRGSAKTSYSYQDLDYAENLILRLIDAFNSNTQEKWYIIIWEQLIKFDFNNVPIHDCGKRLIERYSRKFATPAERYKFLILILKMIRQVALHSSWHYRINEPSLKAYLEGVILEELNWLGRNNPNLISQFF